MRNLAAELGVSPMPVRAALRHLIAEGGFEMLPNRAVRVPRMTREQLRAAIEGPVAVGGGKIAPRLVQRLLHDVDALAGQLQDEGAKAFVNSWHELMDVIAAKSADLAMAS